MKFDVIIIGGGVAGVCTAINAKNDNNSILVIEHNDRLLRKVLSTGNGKCNITNTYCTLDLLDKNPEGLYPYYSSGSINFIKKILRKKDCNSTMIFFESLGVLLENKNGYVYPRNEQALTIRNALIGQCEKIGINTRLSYEVKKIEHICQNGYNYIINGEIMCKSLVFATGGMAAPKLGADGSGLNYARNLGLKVIKPRPALCGVKCSDGFTQNLSGIRTDCSVRLIGSKGDICADSKGNLQFGATGVSGIPIFQISNTIGKLLADGHKISLKIDLLPEIDSGKLFDLLNKNYPDSLQFVVNKKLADVIEKLSEKKAKPINEAVKLIKNFSMHPTGLNSWDEAQVMAGGIATSCICADNMESFKNKQLFLVGEMLDVDGICGGYNLQWAISTGMICGEYIRKLED